MTATPRRIGFAMDDGEMAGLVWERPGAPRIVFVHGNGFHARAYAKMLQPLAARHEVVAIDLRGHGRTTLPADPAGHKSWHIHARDIGRVIEQLDDRPFIAAGHSMGATSLILAAGAMARQPLALALIEPVILPTGAYMSAHSPFWTLMSDPMPQRRTALKRRGRWDSREAVIESYRAKPAFARWADGVLDDYLAEALIDEDDGVRLACAPAWEAANFTAQRHRPIAAARALETPIHALKAERGSTLYTPARLTRLGADIATLPGTSHLAPMEKPGACAAWVMARAEGVLGG